MSVGKHPPLRALLISLAALAIPVTGAFVVPDVLQDYEALLWMLAVVPAFLLAYYKAWRGAAIALAAAMAAVSVTYAITQATGRPMPDLMLAVLVVIIGVSLGAGMLADRIYRRTGAEPEGGFTDPATGLPNKAHADLHLEAEFAHARLGRSLAVVMLDVDNLKGYNAQHGAIAGDELLKLVAEVLKKTTRRMNLCARYSGDVFLCILGGSDDDGAIAFVNRFQQVLHDVAGARPIPGISGGVATVTPAMKEPDQLLDAARAALKQAKKEGSGRIRVHGRPLNLRLGTDQRSAAAPAEDTPKDPRSIMPEGRGRGRKALIVAEQQPVRVLLARYLNDHGFIVTQVSNVVDGVQSLTVEYDLLFTDVVLHEGIGAELVRAAKLRWPSIQVVGLIQRDAAEGDLLIDTLNSGIDRYLVTPLSLPMVRQHLTELLARRDRLVASVLESRQMSMEFQARTNDAVNALRATEEEYRTLLHSVHEVVFRANNDLVFTFLNDAWQEFTGYAVKDSVGRPAGDFVHDEDRAEFTSVLRSIAAGDRDAARGEVRVMTNGGRARWLELRARRLFDARSTPVGVTGTLEDVTARKEAEEALRRSESASRGLLAAFPDRVLLLSRQGEVLSYGGGTLTPDVRHTIEDIFPSNVAEHVRVMVERAVASGQVQMFEYEVEEGDVAREFELRLATSGNDDVVAVIRNITEKKALEERLRQAQKLEAIGRLAGGLAHDFNNLLTVVQGNAHLLHDEVASDTARDYVAQISLAAERGATLVRQMLAFGRRQVLQPSILNLNALVENTRSMLSRLIGENIALEVDLDPDIGLIRADASQIEQVLVNLAVNACEVMGTTGRLRITTRNGALALHGESQSNDDVVLLTISDNGPGMDAATLERVFEPFFTTKGLANSSGMGLATVYGIVRQSGGTISVASEPGDGTTFEIAFPRVDV
jgi:diguanylate cyclase (GGDEF)-like protein/PAS domain S-box-containing protein